MQFDSVFALLKWFVNREYARAPREPGNHDPLAAGGGARQDDGEEVWKAAMAIARVIAGHGSRRAAIIVALFEEDRPGMKDMGRRFRCSSRTIMRIRGQMLQELTQDFEKVGLINRRYDPAAYMGEEDHGER
jgi:hypothetical protein